MEHLLPAAALWAGLTMTNYPTAAIIALRNCAARNEATAAADRHLNPALFAAAVRRLEDTSTDWLVRALNDFGHNGL
jgi:hypothetical protein